MPQVKALTFKERLQETSKEWKRLATEDKEAFNVRALAMIRDRHAKASTTGVIIQNKKLRKKPAAAGPATTGDSRLQAEGGVSPRGGNAASSSSGRSTMPSTLTVQQAISQSLEGCSITVAPTSGGGMPCMGQGTYGTVVKGPHPRTTPPPPSHVH